MEYVRRRMGGRMLKIVLHSPFSQVAGLREVHLPRRPGMTVGQALLELVDRIPGLMEHLPPGKIDQTFLVIVGGRLAKADSLLADGDEILLVPPIAGG